jgi:hypothetical protein
MCQLFEWYSLRELKMVRGYKLNTVFAFLSNGSVSEEKAVNFNLSSAPPLLSQAKLL